jgi:ferrous iron transport protein A
MSNVSLATLQPGERGTIERIRGSAHGITQRLLEMGLTKGTEVEIIRFAPMGDPIEISVRGYRLSLRREEAESVLLMKNNREHRPPV